MGVTGGRDTVSRLGSLGCAALQSTDARNEGCADGRGAGDDLAPDRDFLLNYVRHFLGESGEGSIPELVFESSYD